VLACNGRTGTLGIPRDGQFLALDIFHNIW
jgi:hypothetical protein